MPRPSLEELAYKYPGCTACEHCVVRDRVVNQITSKVGTKEYCDLHKRPVVWHYWLDEKGKVWVHGTEFCEEFLYRELLSIENVPT